LYLKSEFIDQHRILDDAQKGKFDTKLPCENRAEYENGYKNYTSAYASLTGNSLPERCGWNGRSIRATFEAAFGEPCGEYYVGYAVCSQLLHANYCGFKHGFQTEWLVLMPEQEREVEQDTREQIALAGNWLIAPLVWQVLFVEAMMQGKGTEAYPSRGDFDRFVLSLKTRETALAECRPKSP
jgi:hypothetical protein